MNPGLHDYRFECALAGFLLLGVISGCGKSSPNCVQVGGHVTYLGKPVTSGSISFTPVTQQSVNRPAAGKLNSDGSYSLTSFKEDDGAQPGTYTVSVVSVDRSKAPANAVDRLDVPSLVPRKYSSPATSDLRATIPADATGHLQFDFDLTD